MACYYYILMLLIFISLLTSPPVRAARSLSQAQLERPIIKLGLARLDIPPAGKLSYAHLQHALHRTSLRVSHFHYMLQLHAGRALINSSTPVFADSSSASFLTTLSIGTPPVSFDAIVDTGSDLVWLQCEPCSPCFPNAGLNSTIFDPSLSSTYSVLPCSGPVCTGYPESYCGVTGTIVPCSYNTSYGDGSFTAGDLSVDTLTLPDPSGAVLHLEGFTFGCGHDNVFTTSVGEIDGIVGLGLGAFSLPSQLNISILSYCLQSITDPASITSSLYLGEVAQLPASSNGPTLITQFFTNPIIQDATFYYVKLNGISVDGQLVTATSNGAFDILSDGTGGMIVDSGTTFTSLQRDAYNAVVDAFTASIALPPASATSSLCYDLSSASAIQFPSLTFHFEGADLELPLGNYFTAFQDDNLICLTLAGPSDLSVSIFGNIQQQNFFITYDLQAFTLSLTPTTCDS